MSSSTLILGTLLHFTFSKSFQEREAINVIKELKNLFKIEWKKEMILHIDEFQYSLKICEAILRACKLTMEGGFSVRILPIFSGLSDHLVISEEPTMSTSGWNQVNIRMQPFVVAPFYARVMDKLKLGELVQVPSEELIEPSLGKIVQVSDKGEGRIVKIEDDLVHVRVGYDLDHDCLPKLPSKT